MAGFLYFVPGAQTGDQALERLREAGLSHAVELIGQEGPATNQVAPGPEGLTGYTVGRGGHYLFDKDAQEWHRIPGSEDPGLFFGWQKDAPPGPADLARPKQIDGHRVALGDGNAWTCPVAFCPVDEHAGLPAVPRVITLAADGSKEYVVREDYRRLWDLACAFWAEVMASTDGTDEKTPPAEGDKPASFTWIGRNELGAVVTKLGNLFDLTCELLAVNYLVGRAEVSALELLDSANAALPAMALVDSPSQEGLEKKAPPSGGASTSPGAGG